ncbi:MAG: protease complex subunit PrcB family protein [Planctomycetota bacterium]|jgi:hypothetical protein
MATSAPADPGSLAVLKASVRLPRKAPAGKGRLQLKGDLATTMETRGFDPLSDRMRVTVGPAVLLDTNLGGPVVVKTRRDGWKRMTQRGLAGRRDRTRFDLQPSSGVFRISARGEHVAALAAGGGSGVVVEVTLGEEVFTTSVDFGGGQRHWIFDPSGTIPPRPGPTPGPPPPPTPGPAPGPITWSVVQNGPYSGIVTKQNVLIRSYADWAKYFPPPPPGVGAPVVLPNIDFTKETGVAIFMGAYPTGGHSASVTSVTRSDMSLVVNYNESHAQGCPVIQATTTPHVIIKVKGLWTTATYKKQTLTLACGQ